MRHEAFYDSLDHLVLRTIALSIRHAPGLEKLDFLWNLLRGPYHWLSSFGNNGMRVVVGRKFAVRIPPEYSGATRWEDYEPESASKFAEWIAYHTNAIILDVGSAFGVFSVTALFASKESSVIAFDGDLASLKATSRVCQYASGERLQLVYGLISESDVQETTITQAVQRTSQLLKDLPISGDIDTTKYICLHGNSDRHIPLYTLDSLLSEVPSDRPLLLKCDVEGAEFLVLRGAMKILQTHRPTLLISVHPNALPDYGITKADIELFLQDSHYAWEVIAIDHEEHWWCQPI